MLRMNIFAGSEEALIESIDYTYRGLCDGFEQNLIHLDVWKESESNEIVLKLLQTSYRRGSASTTQME